jgi:putative zinc ribbon protein
MGGQESHVDGKAKSRCGLECWNPAKLPSIDHRWLDYPEAPALSGFLEINVVDRRTRETKPGSDDVADSAERRWSRHPLYGNIPLNRRTTVDRDGRTHEWWEYDATFSPRVPKGAVPGDVSKQVFCSACNEPKYFYVNETRTCVQCGSHFTFSGAEQKYWYETRKFNFASAPIRCKSCRRLRRSEHAMREQIARARQATRDVPRDPGAHLALARAIVEYHERTGGGHLDDAVAAARKAAGLWSDAPDATLWEGIAHARAGRARQARERLSEFLDRAPSVHASLFVKAREYLAQVSA